jgi:hypothetical protein
MAPQEPGTAADDENVVHPACVVLAPREIRSQPGRHPRWESLQPGQVTGRAEDDQRGPPPWRALLPAAASRVSRAGRPPGRCWPGTRPHPAVHPRAPAMLRTSPRRGESGGGPRTGCHCRERCVQQRGTRFRRRSSGTWTGPSSGRSSAPGDALRGGVVDGGAAGDRMPAPGIPTEVMMTEASIGQGLEPTAAAVLPVGVRENAHLRQPRRAVLRGDRPDRGADRRLSHRPSPTWPTSTPRSPSTKRCTRSRPYSASFREADQDILLDLIGTVKKSGVAPGQAHGRPHGRPVQGAEVLSAPGGGNIHANCR